MGFFEWLGQLDSSVLQLAIFGGSAAVGVSAWAGFSAWRRIRQSEHRTRLTAMMLERGMNGEQIERIIRAGFIGRDVPTLDEEAKAGQEATNADPEVRIIKHLAACYYEADDSQKIVAAARRNGTIDAATVSIIETLSENWEDTDAIVKLLEGRRDRLAGGGEVSATTPTLAGAGAA